MKHISGKRVLACLLSIIFLCGACGGKEEVEAGGIVGGARLIIPTGGYLPSTMPVYKHWLTGGLAELGDVDGDGCTDLLIGSGEYPGSFAAYSGQDGKMLWRVKAKTSKTTKVDGEKGYVFKDFVLIGDQNGDGIPEIFIRNDWTDKEAFIYSGKDGARILRQTTGRITCPLRTYDLSGDGGVDLVFIHIYRLSVRALSVKDFAETLVRTPLLKVDAKSVKLKLLAPKAQDINEDGIAEYMVSTDDKENAEILFLSGKDFSILKRLPVTQEIAATMAHVACPGDLNEDGTPDLVVTNNRGAEVNAEVSYLAAHSGKDGAQLWQVAGSSLPGGPTRIRIDVKTKKRRKLPGDVKFGDPVTFLPDLNGDGAVEIACALPTLIGKKRARGVLIFSGATGEHLATLTLGSRQGRLRGGQMLVLKAFGKEGKPALAVDGQLEKKKYMVAIFDLPRIVE